MTHQTTRVTAIYDAIDAFQRTHRLPSLQHAQIRGLLAEHLDRALPAAVSAAVAPPTQAADEIRDQLLHAIDHAYTTGVLGYTSPEELLAAYDTSRTPATSRAVDRDRIAAALYERERPPLAPHWADALAADREVFQAMADAVLAVLPELTDRAAVLGEEADRIDATRADFPIAVQNGITWATAEMRRHATELRRMADETATETPKEQ